MSELGKMWQRELNSVARSYVRDLSRAGLGEYAYHDAVAQGADPDAAEEGLVTLATEADLAELLRRG